MKRKKHQKKKTIIIFILIFLFVILIVPAYAYMRKQLNIEGNASILVKQEENICKGTVTYKSEKWGSGDKITYKLSFTILNNSDKDYNFWDVYFDVPEDTIISSSSSSVTERIGNKVKVSNEVYNSSIPVGETVSFEIQLITSNANYEPTSITINNCVANPDNNTSGSYKNLLIEFKQTNSYGTYNFQYDVIITNNGDTTLKGWNFSIEKDKNTELSNAWNANYIVKDDSIEFSNLEYNNEIAPQKSVSFGMTISTTNKDYFPTIKKGE